jgi:hypothetical protein
MHYQSGTDVPALTKTAGGASSGLGASAKTRRAGVAIRKHQTENSVMKYILAAAVLCAAAIGMQSAAIAQNAPTYRYCMMNNSHPGNIGSVLCRYSTIAQCLASRHSFADTCYINPEYGRRK